jgi:ketosteroid isomerase-like protein
VLARALELEPAGRFESAVEMRAALLDRGSVPHVAPHRRAANDSRRIDAAMPSQAEVGRLTDLIVQVRFADSPRLGLEDWPARRAPSQIEQRSEQINLVYARDPATGSALPAQLRIKIVAPDFKIEGQAEQQIEVPPDEYSKRLVFLLSPQRAGFCRVNVEVYDPAAMYLGTIAVEAEAVRSGVTQPLLRVANLVLGVFARQGADAMRRESPAVSVDSGATQKMQPRAAMAPRAAPALADAIVSIPSVASRAPMPSQAVDRRESSVLLDSSPPRRRTGLRRAMVIAPLAVIAVAIGTDLIIRRQSGVPPAAAVAPLPAAPAQTVPNAPNLGPAGSPAPGNTLPAPTPGQPPPGVTTSRPTASAPVAGAPPADFTPAPSKPSPAVAPPSPSPSPAPSSSPSANSPNPPSVAPPPSPPPNISPPNAPTAAAPSSSSVSDEAPIRAVLRAYVDAYSQLDAAKVRAVFPTVNAQALRDAFSTMSSLDVRIEDERITINGPTATVSCTWTTVASSRTRAGRTQKTSVKTVLALEKMRDEWVIVSRR